MRDLDHFVLAIDDLPAVAPTWEALGFQVMPRMRHTRIGTSNRIVQLHDTYVELVTDAHRAPAHLRRRLEARTAFGDGYLFNSLTSTDLEADHAAFTAAGLHPEPILSAARDVVMPDGRTEATDSSCVYCWHPERPFASLFTSAHHRPDIIWVPDYQVHANTARRAVCLTYASTDPDREEAFVSAVLGGEPRDRPHGGVGWRTPRGERLEILPASSLAARYSEVATAWEPAMECVAVGLTIEVADLAACRAAVAGGGVEVVDLGERLLVDAARTGGSVLELVGSA